MSIHTGQFKHPQRNTVNTIVADATAQPLRFTQHSQSEPGTHWKSALNNLRLLLQPYWCWGWLEGWLQVFYRSWTQARVTSVNGLDEYVPNRSNPSPADVTVLISNSLSKVTNEGLLNEGLLDVDHLYDLPEFLMRSVNA